MEPTESTGVSQTPDVPRESTRTILFQFVVFPLGVVLIGVAVFLLFGMLASEDHSIREYLSEIRSGSSHRRWQAAYQLSKSLKRGEGKGDPALEPEVAQLFVAARDDDPKVRRYLSVVLGTLGDRRATPVLISALHDPDIDTRIYSILALGEIADPRSAAPLIALSSDSEPDIRKTAVYALGAFRDPQVASALAAALADPVADVRWNAALALSRWGDPRALPVLKEMLDRTRLNRVPGIRPDQAEEAMMAAIDGYTRVAGGGAAADLQRLASTDPSLRVRSEAKSQLARISR
jgi:HEAT repeat protein